MPASEDRGVPAPPGLRQARQQARGPLPWLVSGPYQACAGGIAVYEGLPDAEHLSLDGLPESGAHEQLLTEGGEPRLVMSVQAQTSAGRSAAPGGPGPQRHGPFRPN